MLHVALNHDCCTTGLLSRCGIDATSRCKEIRPAETISGMKLIPPLRLALFLVLASAAHLAAEERWYVFSIGGVPVGYVMEEIDGARTRTAVFARLARLGKTIDMRFDTTTTEDADGDFQSLEYEAVLSKQPVRVEARVHGDRIQVATPPHERFVERGAARVLGPLVVRRLSAERLRAPGDAIE